jgi:hypothetical protein
MFNWWRYDAQGYLVAKTIIKPSQRRIVAMMQAAKIPDCVSFA